MFRGKPEIHKRLMFLATIALLDAVADRLPILWRVGRYAHFLVQDVFVVVGSYLRSDVTRAGEPGLYLGRSIDPDLPPPAHCTLYHFVIPVIGR